MTDTKDMFHEKVEDLREEYVSATGHTMKREYGTKTPNGNKMDGHWVVRDKNKRFVDFHTHSNDLIDKHGLKPKK
jgi:hypothetical protein